MKKTLGLLLIGIVTVCSALPGPAADAPSEKQAVKKKTPPRSLPFQGTVAAVDVAAKTLTVGKRVFHLTPDTKVFKDNQPVGLSQDLVGERIGGAYLKTADGTLQAVTIRLGKKPDRKSGSNKKPAKDGSP